MIIVPVLTSEQVVFPANKTWTIVSAERKREIPYVVVCIERGN
jgi:hypothetical protein